MMHTLEPHITEYLEYCELRKRLDAKTLKAYRIDLNQYLVFSAKFPQYYSKQTVDYFITI